MQLHANDDVGFHPRKPKSFRTKKKLRKPSSQSLCPASYYPRGRFPRFHSPIARAEDEKGYLALQSLLQNFLYSGQESISFPNQKWPRRRQIQSRGFALPLAVTLSRPCSVLPEQPPTVDGETGCVSPLFLRLPIDPSS